MKPRKNISKWYGAQIHFLFSFCKLIETVSCKMAVAVGQEFKTDEKNALC